MTMYSRDLSSVPVWSKVSRARKNASLQGHTQDVTAKSGHLLRHNPDVTQIREAARDIALHCTALHCIALHHDTWHSPIWWSSDRSQGHSTMHTYAWAHL